MDNILDLYTNHGFIYILTHPSYNGSLKISRTNNLTRRMKTHCCSHMTNPIMVYTIKTINYSIAEHLIHQKLRQHKVKCNSSREFFNVDINIAINVINEIVNMIDNPIIIDTNQ